MTGITERALRVTLKLHPEDVKRSPVIQTVKEGVRCIPGTTYKGAVRASMENWFRELASKGARALTPCVPVVKSALSEAECRLVRKGELRKGCTVQVGNGKVILPPGQKGICPACTLFGAQGLVGFVRCGFLRDRGDQFEGKIRVLWADESRGWEFGKRRTVGKSVVDLLEMEPERLLDVLRQRISEMKSIGAKRPRDADHAGAVGSLRILSVQVVEQAPETL
ncbi:MAG: hypothetical protein C4341_04520 [Armatimonadota bacterium]